MAEATRPVIRCKPLRQRCTLKPRKVPATSPSKAIPLMIAWTRRPGASARSCTDFRVSRATTRSPAQSIVTSTVPSAPASTEVMWPGSTFSALNPFGSAIDTITSRARRRTRNSVAHRFVEARYCERAGFDLKHSQAECVVMHAHLRIDDSASLGCSRIAETGLGSARCRQSGPMR